MILSENPFIVFDNCSLPKDMHMSLLQVNNFSPSTGFSATSSKNTLIDQRKSYTAILDESFVGVTKYLMDFVNETYKHKYNLDQAEPLQLTQYDTGGEYKSHHDYFYDYDLNHYRKMMPNAKHLIGKKDRVATIILYLNDDFEGGTTDFPKLHISVKPVTGHILYFTYPDRNEAAVNTYHTGTVVTKGTKKILTLWIRQ